MINPAKDTGQVIDIYIQGRYSNHILDCKECAKKWNSLILYSSELSKQIGDHTK